MNPLIAPNKFTYMRALVLATLFLTIAVIQFYDAALAQTEPPPGQAWPVDPGSTVDPGSKLSQELPTNYVIQSAEQSKDTVMQNVEALLTDSPRQFNETYGAMHTFGGDDIISCLLASMCQLIGKWVSERQGFICAIVAGISFIPNKKSGSRSLRSIGVRLIFVMTLIGFAFALPIGDFLRPSF